MYCLLATSAGEKSRVPLGILGFDAIAAIVFETANILLFSRNCGVVFKTYELSGNLQRSDDFKINKVSRFSAFWISLNFLGTQQPLP